ncbi:Alpha/Beta hydrolase protein [Earliella scabrosa]|nr:Alpha/Beta hydrolase protein [Earliella scabrosa]
MDPELAAALLANPTILQPPPPRPENVSFGEHAREHANVVQAPFAKFYGERLPPAAHYEVFDKAIPVDNGEIASRIVRPTAGGDGATYPVFVWFHGGGWVTGDLDMDDAHLRSISVELQVGIVNVNYRPVNMNGCVSVGLTDVHRHAPEYTFPASIEDCYAALKWVVDNASELRVSPKSGFIVGGDSAGGNLSAAVALKARDDPFFSATPLTGQYLREPAVVHPRAVPDKYKAEMRSFAENKDALFLSAESTLFFFDTYGAPPTDLRVSPLLASSHAGLPPAFIQVMELDPIRDDGIVYEKVLREAGVPTRLVRNAGVPHGSHYSFPHISPAVKIDRDARDGLKWLLSLSKGL